MRRYFPRAITRVQSKPLGGLLLRQVFPVLLFMGVLWALRDRLPEINPGEVIAGARDIGFWNWVAALLATLVSFAAIGRYDRLAHTILRTNIAPDAARQSGMAAVAVAQFAGFGLLTGTLARWRLLPGLSMGDAARLTAFVSGSFLIGWFVLASLVDWATGSTVLPRWLHPVILAAALALVLAPNIYALWPRRFPSSRAMIRIFLAVAGDLGFAALAFYVLLPEGTGISFPAFLTAFLFAVMAGLVCGTPGGLGALELTLLAHLPGHAEAEILTAAVAFRLIYHACPAMIGALTLFFGLSAARTKTTALPPSPNTQVSNFAELGLIHAGHFAPAQVSKNSTVILAEEPQSLIALGRQSTRDTAATLNALTEQAATQLKSCLYYRATPRMAAIARRQGWRAVHIGREALIPTTTYRLDTPHRRQLRRQIAKAHRAGVTIRPADTTRDADALTKIASAWRRTHMTERGYVMGQFSLEYLSHQRIWIAEANGRPIAFVSLHLSARDWTLDLMRQSEDAPPGTMHLLVHEALCTAKAEAIPTVSLANLPTAPRKLPSVLRRIGALYESRAGTAGLARFKSAFAPNWQERYALAPNTLALGVGLLTLAQAINAKTNPKALQQAHNDYDEFEFDS